jgi:hypothetical protein
MFALRNPRAVWLAMFGLFAAIRPAAAGAVREVVELFTSQGCSSCPPADRVLGDLAKNPDILAVSLPIDYWDYIGWRDTLASPLFTARQKSYAEATGQSQIYTPQAIVNGLKDAVGSDPLAIEKAARQTLETNGVMAVPLDVSARGATIDISIGDAPLGAPTQAGVYLLALARSKSVTVLRGENAGSTLNYANVVRAIIKIGEWDGKKLNLSADEALAHVDGADSFAVVLQAGGRAQPGAMLAAWGS